MSCWLECRKKKDVDAYDKRGPDSEEVAWVIGKL